MPERNSTSHLGSAADRTRVALHYERDNAKGDPLLKLPVEPVTGTKMETFAEHLVPNSDDPADNASTFVPGKLVRLGTPAISLIFK